MEGSGERRIADPGGAKRLGTDRITGWKIGLLQWTRHEHLESADKRGTTDPGGAKRLGTDGVV